MKHFICLLASICLFSATGKTQQFSSDFFEVAYTTTGTKMWTDQGSDADRNLTIWTPAGVPDGFFVLGDMVTNDYTSPAPSSIVLKPKQGFENLLTSPTSLESVWTDAGSDADRDLIIYRLNCPDGYVALGMVVTNGSDSRPDCKCIKKQVRHDGKVHDLVTKITYRWEGQQPDFRPFWDDKGSDADNDVALFKVGMNSEKRAPQNTLMLAPTVFFASDNYSSSPYDTPYALLLRSDISNKIPKTPEPELPELTSTAKPQEGPETEITYSIPFYMVQDDKYTSTIEQAGESPLYKVKKTIKYVPVATTLSQKDGTTISWTVTKSKAQSADWNSSSSHEFSVSTTIGAEVGAAPLGIGATANVSVTTGYALTTGHSWGGSETTGSQLAAAVTLPVDKDQRAVIYEVVEEYRLFRNNGAGSEVEDYNIKKPNHYIEFQSAYFPKN